MPIKFGSYFEPDAFDREMERRGWLNEVEAGDQLGMPLTALRSMADCGEIKLTVVKGRRYVEAESVSRRLARFGYPSADQRRLAYIEGLPNDAGLCGSLGQERNEILQRMQDRENARDRAMGAHSPHPTLPSVSRGAPTDPGEAFVRKIMGDDR